MFKTNTLRRCPFCEGKPMTFVDKAFQDKFVVQCEDCGAEKRDEYSMEDAIRKWQGGDNKTQAKMSNLQFLLTKLSEECNEVGQMAAKCQQFGLDEIYSGEGNTLTNRQRLHIEIDDLLCMVQLLNEEEGFNYLPNENGLDKKKAKVFSYREYSIDLGMVEEK